MNQVGMLVLIICSQNIKYRVSAPCCTHQPLNLTFPIKFGPILMINISYPIFHLFQGLLIYLLLVFKLSDTSISETCILENFATRVL